jgi:hypothetical protein
MKSIAKYRARLGGVVLAGCVALWLAPAASAQQITAETVVDQARILNLIQHYYYNFGRENPENFSDFYAEDAELILGTKHFKGKAGIMKAYGRGGDAPKPAAEKKPHLTFNVTISNPLITVHGDTASSELIFTEYRQEKPDAPMKMTTQGREYSTFVKVDGQWRYKSRHITGGNEPPDDWKE